MDFTGPLNYINRVTQSTGSSAQKAAFAADRMGRLMTIHDGRASQSELSEPRDSTALLANGAGFLLVRSPSAVTDWRDTKAVAACYYEETRVLLQQLLPAAVVPRIDWHTYRNEDIQEHHWIDGIQYGPCAAGVHNDYADFVSDDGKTTIRKFSELMAMPSDRRIIGINIWRSVTPAPLARFPLAVCDRTTVAVSDLEYDLNPHAKPEPFNAHYCKPNEAHRWSYFSDMTNEEALVFTTYDSHPSDGEVFCPTLHSAVPIPGSDGLQPRESIEVRFFVNLPLD